MGIGGTERRQPDVVRRQARLLQRGLASGQLQRIERDDGPLTVGDDEEVRGLFAVQDVLEDRLEAMIDASRTMNRPPLVRKWLITSMTTCRTLRRGPGAR